MPTEPVRVSTTRAKPHRTYLVNFLPRKSFLNSAARLLMSVKPMVITMTDRAFDSVLTVLAELPVRNYAGSDLLMAFHT